MLFSFPRTSLVRRRSGSLVLGLLVLVIALLAGTAFRSEQSHRDATPLAAAAVTFEQAPEPPAPEATPDQPLAAPPAVAAPPTAQVDPPPPAPYFDTHRIVAYYGHPWARGMGIVGEYEPAELVRRLRAQADRYQALDPSREVVPAIHLIFAVAQANAGADGLYLGRMPDELVRFWIDFTRENGLLLFLDIQFGRSTVEREMAAILPYLEESHVNLALDPEFKWGPNQFPQQNIGSLDGAEINRAQELLQAFMAERGISHKIVIAHQFLRSMITNKQTIKQFNGIDFVIDADGYGAPETKIGSYNAVVRDDGIGYPGFKLFYKHDAESGRLMREEEVLGLDPPPVLIIYQ